MASREEAVREVGETHAAGYGREPIRRSAHRRRRHDCELTLVTSTSSLLTTTSFLTNFSATVSTVVAALRSSCTPLSKTTSSTRPAIYRPTRGLYVVSTPTSVVSAKYSCVPGLSRRSATSRTLCVVSRGARHCSTSSTLVQAKTAPTRRLLVSSIPWNICHFCLRIPLAHTNSYRNLQAIRPRLSLPSDLIRLLAR
jgi:hypothetical protein